MIFYPVGMSIPANIDRNSLPQFSVQVAPDVHKASSVNSLPPELVTPGDIRMGGSGVASLTKAKKGDMIEGADNLATLQENCNAQVNNVGDFVNVCAASGLIDAAQAQEYQAAINQINNTLQTRPITSDNARSAMNALEGVCGSMMTDCKGRIDQLKQSGVLSGAAAQEYEANFNQIQDQFQATQITINNVLLNAQVADIFRSDGPHAVNSPTRGPLSDVEAKELKADTLKCLTSNDPEDIKKLAKTASDLTANGLPEDQGSLNDIVTALMLLQLKYAMEGKKANREMSAEMAATIYQNGQKIAANILERGELSYKQAMASAFVNFAGAVAQSTLTFVGNHIAYKKETKDTQNLDKGALGSSDAKQDKYNDPTKQAIISQFGATGSLVQAGTGLIANVTNAALGLKVNELEGENKKLETLNRLNENVQQGIRDVAESFNSLIKMTLQMMQSLNSLANQGQSAITGNMRS